MKKVFLFLIVSLLIITSCGDTNNDDNLKKITNVSLTGGVETLAIGDSCTLAAIVTPDNILNEIQGYAGWEISDKSVIQIKPITDLYPTIRVIGMKEGKTTISFYTYILGKEDEKKTDSITIQIVP